MEKQSVTVKVTEKDLFHFFLYHNYTRPSGILTGILGLVALVALPIAIGKDLFTGLLFGVLAFSFLLQPLVSFFLKSRSQVKHNPVFSREMAFTVVEEGIHIDQHQSSQTLKWEQVVKVAESKKMILLYVSKVQAFLIPKHSFESPEKAQAFLEALKGGNGNDQGNA